MRKALVIALALLLATGAAGWVLLRGRDPVASARQRMARQDMRGAELYLRQAIRQHPQDPIAAFLLGEVDLALGNAAAAELQLRRAADRGYSHAAIVLPLGQAYLQQRHFDAALHDFDPANGPPAERADKLTIRAAAQLALGDPAAARATIDQARAAAPDGRDTQLTAARIALAQGRLDDAETYANHVLARTPGDQDARMLLAELALQRQDPKTALAGVLPVIAASPGRLDALMVQARALTALDRRAEARRVLARVLLGSPRNIGANFLAAVLAAQDRDFTTADACLTRIGPDVEKVPRGEYLLAMVKLGVGQSALAEEADAKFLAREPDDIPALKLAAAVALARRQPAAALTMLQRSPLSTQPDADTLDLQGQAEAMQGQAQTARASFADAARLAPGNTQILNRLAASSLNLGDGSGAEAALRQSLKIEPYQRVPAEALVQAALARGDLAAANQGLAQLRKMVGDDETVGQLAAQVKLASLDLDGAQAQLRDLLRRFPDSRTAGLNLVRLDGLRGDTAGAEAQLRAMLRLHPGDVSALQLLLPVLLAEKHMDEAMHLAEAAHTAVPDSAAVTALLAGAYVRNQQPDRAVALLDRTSAQNPQLDALHARVLAADGHPDQAGRVYKDLLARNPGDVRARLDWADLLATNKQLDEARSVLRDGLGQSPGNAVLMGAMIQVSLRQGGIQRALADAATLRSDPANLPAARLLDGEAWLAVGNRAQAATAFVAAYRNAPSTELATRAATSLATSGATDQAIKLLADWVKSHPGDPVAASILSSLYIGANRLDDASRQLATLLAARPTDPTALNNLAWVKQQQGDAGQALALAQRAYFMAPSAKIADTLGWILARQKDARALPILAQAALAEDPATQAEASYHYGVALHDAGRTDEARSQLRRALAASPAFPEAGDARRILDTLR